MSQNITRTEKTRLLREVKKLAVKLPPVPKEILDLAAASTGSVHWGYHEDGRNECLHCGHVWQDPDCTPSLTGWGTVDYRAERRCPHCGSPIVMDFTRHRSDAWYFAVLENVSGWPVMRILTVERRMSKSTGDTTCIAEILQTWFDGRGNFVIGKRPTGMNGLQTAPDLYSFAEFRVNNLDSLSRRIIVRDFAYASPEAVRTFAARGFNGDLRDLEVDTVIRGLFTHPKFESMWKIGTPAAMSILKYKYRETLLDKWWKQCVMLANSERQYNLDTWLDHLKVLMALGKDINNRFYVLPEDLETEHNRMNRMLENKREKMRQKQREDADLAGLPEMISKATEAFEKAKKRYFGIKLTDGTITVTTLDSIQQYFNDSCAMHHCLYHNRYWEKMDTLCLRATNSSTGKLIANIELDLDTYEIRQCYGLQNKIVPQDAQIRALIAGNTGRYKAASRKRSTVTLTAPVFATA